jgi:superfamily II helicase
MPALSRSF